MEDRPTNYHADAQQNSDHYQPQLQIARFWQGWATDNTCRLDIAMFRRCAHVAIVHSVGTIDQLDRKLTSQQLH